MSLLHEVEVPRLPVSRLEPVIGAPRYAELARARGQLRPVLAGRTIWNVNSTTAGGGVAEMLQVLVGYVQDLDTVSRPAAIVGQGRPGPGDPVLVQVSRWDRLKDMAGVMRGFADHVAPGGDGYLMLVGPAVKDVSDDPEGAAVYGECLLQWRDLSPAARRRILLVTLPLDDIDENAAMVNALQRYATVIAQKSLAEGFGLTVSEGMWKGRPVIGSAVGGIIDQIAEGTGILLPDPADLAAFGSAARLLLGDQDQAARMGQAAHAHIRERYVGDVHLLRYAKLLGSLIGGE